MCLQAHFKPVLKSTHKNKGQKRGMKKAEALHRDVLQSIYSKLSQGKSKSFADSALQYKKESVTICRIN